MLLGLLDGDSGCGAKELVCCWDLRNGLPTDLSHDGALPSKVLEAQAQEAVDHEGWQRKGGQGQQG